MHEYNTCFESALQGSSQDSIDEFATEKNIPTNISTNNEITVTANESEQSKCENSKTHMKANSSHSPKQKSSTELKRSMESASFH